MNLIRLVSAAAALCFSHAAQAQVKFSTPASGCVPDHATIRDNRALVGNASVRHAASNIDPIVLTCPIPPFDTMETNWVLSITYLDSNGAGANAFVRARLYRIAFDSATPELLETVTSNASAAVNLHTVNGGVFPHPVNFNTGTYWIRIDLQRATTSQNVIFHSVALDGVSPSDIRLKHNIALLGRLTNGLGFYRFSYHGSDKAYVGVMAQEVEAVIPDAVVRGSDGYLRVFYDRLGLRMQAWEDWVASGARIPVTVQPQQQGTLR